MGSSDYLAEYVALPPGPRGGLTCPADALRLLFDLEGRGFRLEPRGDMLIIQPHAQLTEDDCRQIRRWKLHLLALLAYVPPELG